LARAEPAKAEDWADEEEAIQRGADEQGVEAQKQSTYATGMSFCDKRVTSAALLIARMTQGLPIGVQSAPTKLFYRWSA
jgi:hypothetical protein